MVVIAAVVVDSEQTSLGEGVATITVVLSSDPVTVEGETAVDDDSIR